MFLNVLEDEDPICLKGVATGYVPDTKMCAYDDGKDACQVKKNLLLLARV